MIVSEGPLDPELAGCPEGLHRLEDRPDLEASIRERPYLEGGRKPGEQHLVRDDPWQRGRHPRGLDDVSRIVVKGSIDADVPPLGPDEGADLLVAPEDLGIPSRVVPKVLLRDLAIIHDGAPHPGPGQGARDIDDLLIGSARHDEDIGADPRGRYIAQ